MAKSTSTLKLAGFAFGELQTAQGLAKLDRSFLDYLSQQAPLLKELLLSYRQDQQTFDPQELSQLLLDIAPHVETFLVRLFGIENANEALSETILAEDPIFAFKKHYVLKLARRQLKKPPTTSFVDLQNKLAQLVPDFQVTTDPELTLSQFAIDLLANEKTHQTAIDLIVDWCVLAITTTEGQSFVKNWVSFVFPKRLDYADLVEVVRHPDNKLTAPEDHLRQREGFSLTDPRMSRRQVLDEIHYCVYCHKNDGDFCSKGFPVKKGESALGLKTNPCNQTLTGCPLEEKISEMHTLKKLGYSIAALAMVMVDNPMCPATGHRICNDCMKACIYQKQEPVNIPQIETRVLVDVLHLPWGVEIYDLLTRWNPLRAEQFVLKPYNGKKVLIMGMGPAGFTLAHHLTMEGFAVVGTDGLKIEGLNSDLINTPIHQYADITERLDERVMVGFGGVAEYGITVRWDKNFLKLIYITLMRRQHFQVFGNVRFGGTITVEKAWELGFDHVALAVGAGLPRELNIPKSLATGMRQANDFLMALQLTGAAKKSSLANLQVRLPAIVIGGGLTGIDTATEVQAYYLAQITKIADRYHTLITTYGEDAVRGQFDQESLLIVDEWLNHARELKLERELAQAEQRQPNTIKLLRQWGGVTIAYRRAMQESPAYRSNHEEVTKAMEEGIYYAEGLNPEAVLVDEFGAVKAMRFEQLTQDADGNWQAQAGAVTLPARAIFVATGAKPNVAYEFEHRGTFKRDGFQYVTFDAVESSLKEISAHGHVKNSEFGPFTSYIKDHHRVSFLGDTHPLFHGNVVKAIASAQRSYRKIRDAILQLQKPAMLDDYDQFAAEMKRLFAATVVSVTKLAPKVFEIKVHAPLAAQNFHPGQFYRLQNYEQNAPTIHDTLLQTEAVALLAAPDAKSDHLNFVVIENGVSTRLLTHLKTDAHVALMGPTGAKTNAPVCLSEVTENWVLMIVNVLGMQLVRSVAASFKAVGIKIAFVGVFADETQIFYHDEIEAVADFSLWHVGDGVSSGLYDELKQQLPDVIFSGVNVVLNADQLCAFKQATQDQLQMHMHPDTKTFAAVYGPMQCMLKGVCAQCLQWQIDPKTGLRKKAVYACSWQHQPLELIDIDNLNERLRQNKVQERLSDLWLDYLFEHHKAATTAVTSMV